MTTKPLRREHVAGLVCNVVADVELTRIRILSGGRRFDVNRCVPVVFKASVGLASASAEQLLQWVRTYRQVVDVFCEIRDGGCTAERMGRLQELHRLFVASSLALMEGCLARP